MRMTENTSKQLDGRDAFVQGQGYEAIILAGGLGTRLRSVVSDLPK